MFNIRIIKIQLFKIKKIKEMLKLFLNNKAKLIATTILYSIDNLRNKISMNHKLKI